MIRLDLVQSITRQLDAHLAHAKLLGRTLRVIHVSAQIAKQLKQELDAMPASEREATGSLSPYPGVLWWRTVPLKEYPELPASFAFFIAESPETQELVTLDKRLQ